MHNIIYWLLGSALGLVLSQMIKAALDFGRLLEMAEQERDI